MVYQPKDVQFAGEANHRDFLNDLGYMFTIHNFTLLTPAGDAEPLPGEGDWNFTDYVA
jgi:hypothetical protein